VNPTIGVPLLKGANDKIGFHTWTEEELERFEKRWPVGSRERLAFDLLLFTGLRRGDAVRLGRQHVRDGLIRLRMEKTGEELVVPLLQPLAKSIEATTTGDLTYLVNDAGQPWVKESFGNWFRDVCSAAGCPGSAHGLRKAGATRAALNGATVNQLMAMYGWTTPKMALHYTRLADRERLARAAGEHLLPARSGNKSARTSRTGAGARAKTSNKSGR
jgi:integrase